MSENDKNKTSPLTLTGANIAVLGALLPQPSWYKEHPKQALMIMRAVAAHEALPDIGKIPTPEKGEDQAAFEAREKAFSDREFPVELQTKNIEAVKTCLKFMLKNGALGATKHTVRLIKVFDLGNDEADE